MASPILVHSYADDTQLYIPPETKGCNLNSLLDCLEDTSPKELNESKSVVILFGPPDSFKLMFTKLSNLSTLVEPYFKNLGVIFDSAYKFDKPVNAAVKASFFQLCTIAKIKFFSFHKRS